MRAEQGQQEKPDLHGVLLLYSSHFMYISYYISCVCLFYCFPQWYDSVRQHATYIHLITALASEKTTCIRKNHLHQKKPLALDKFRHDEVACQLLCKCFNICV